MDYTPRHAQPVTLAQLRQLEPELLTGEIARLENSIQHLEASNVELRVWAGISSAGKPDDGTATTAAAVDDDDEQLDEDSKREFAEAVRENEETVASQRERLTMIRLALEEKIGVDAANPHYERATAAEAQASSTPNEAAAARNGQAPTTVNGQSTAEEAVSSSALSDEGMYL
ncbi:hypothetical protein B0A53_01906 [Rhodotorula sp. CCFEE 5036]|nr:hypothetical protein B0A53_01906 [Rhodotorula sp. CCFEE 5036]